MKCYDVQALEEDDIYLIHDLVNGQYLIIGMTGINPPVPLIHKIKETL